MSNMMQRSSPHNVAYFLSGYFRVDFAKINSSIADIVDPSRQFCDFGGQISVGAVENIMILCYILQLGIREVCATVLCIRYLARLPSWFLRKLKYCVNCAGNGQE